MNVKKNEIGSVRDMYGSQTRCILGFVGRPKGKKLLLTFTRKWGIILKWISQKMGWEDM
jgi:hypothetical protein